MQKDVLSSKKGLELLLQENNQYSVKNKWQSWNHKKLEWSI